MTDMVNYPDFYIERAHRSFLNVWDGHPNILRHEVTEDGVDIAVRDLSVVDFPTSVDGIPFRYHEETEAAA